LKDISRTKILFLVFVDEFEGQGAHIVPIFCGYVAVTPARRLSTAYHREEVCNLAMWLGRTRSLPRGSRCNLRGFSRQQLLGPRQQVRMYGCTEYGVQT
jgi:hypothetical protein